MVIKTIQRILLNFLINALKEIIICNFIENKKQAIKRVEKTIKDNKNNNIKTPYTHVYTFFLW